MASVNCCELRIENIVDRLYWEVFRLSPTTAHLHIILTHLTEKWMTQERISHRGPYLMTDAERNSSSAAEKGKQSELISTLYGQNNTAPPKRDTMSRRKDLIDLIRRYGDGGSSGVIQDIVSANTRWITDRLSCLSQQEQIRMLDRIREVFLAYLDSIPEAEAQARETCRQLRIRRDGAAGAEGGDNIDAEPLKELLDYVRRQFLAESPETHLRIVCCATGLSWLFLGAALRKAMNSNWDTLRVFLEEPQSPEPALPAVSMGSGQAETTMVSAPKRRTTKDVDVHSELVAKFEELFGPDAAARPEPTPAQKRKADMDNQDALDLLMYQASDTEETKRIWESLKNHSEGEDPEATEEGVPGKYFTMRSPKGIYPIIYQIDRMALPEKHKRIYVAERLDCAIMLLEDGDLSLTFFVSNPAPDGNHLLIFNFFEDQSQVHVNSGFLDYDQVKLSTVPTVLNIVCIQRNGKLPPELEKHFTLDASVHHAPEEKEFAYTFDPEKTFIILDPETTLEIKPELYMENGELRGRVMMTPYKKYFVFQIRSKGHGDSIPLSDYEIGMAYKEGTMKLEKNYRKALHYLKIAASDGSAEAYEELAEFYERGLGCIPNPERAARMREEAQALRSDA